MKGQQTLPGLRPVRRFPVWNGACEVTQYDRIERQEDFYQVPRKKRDYGTRIRQAGQVCSICSLRFLDSDFSQVNPNICHDCYDKGVNP